MQEHVLPITPAFAGRFQSAPLRIAGDGGPGTLLPPVVYAVSAGP